MPNFPPRLQRGDSSELLRFSQPLNDFSFTFLETCRVGPGRSGVQCGPSVRSAPWGNFQSLLKITLQRVARCGGREITALDRFLRNPEGSLSSLLCPPGKRTKRKKERKKNLKLKRKKKKYEVLGGGGERRKKIYMYASRRVVFPHSLLSCNKEGAGGPAVTLGAQLGGPCGAVGLPAVSLP